jgi:integrase
VRDWDDEFIDVPEVMSRTTRPFDRGEMTAILQEAEEPYCTLYALLAGCGPMRAGEALDHDIRSIHEDFRTLEIVQKTKRGELQDHMKTKNAQNVAR